MYLSHLVKCYLRSVATAQLSEEISITTLVEQMENTHGNRSSRNERKHCRGDDSSSCCFSASFHERETFILLKCREENLSSLHFSHEVLLHLREELSPLSQNFQRVWMQATSSNKLALGWDLLQQRMFVIFQYIKTGPVSRGMGYYLELRIILIFFQLIRFQSTN